MADPAQAQAALQTWSAMPWWQKALVSYGKGASDVVRGDVVQPAKWAAGVLSGQQLTDPETGLSGQIPQLVPPGASADYAAQTRDMDAPFNTLKGFGPRMGANVGEAATLLPAGIGIGKAVGAALPTVESGGLLGALRSYAPISAGSSAMGGLEPENRAASALWGALVPGGVGVAAKGASMVGMPLLRAMHEAGLISAGDLYSMLIGSPALATGAASAVRKAIPETVRKIAEPVGDVAKDAAKKPITRPIKAALSQAASLPNSDND